MPAKRISFCSFCHTHTHTHTHTQSYRREPKLYTLARKEGIVFETIDEGDAKSM